MTQTSSDKRVKRVPGINAATVKPFGDIMYSTAYFVSYLHKKDHFATTSASQDPETGIALVSSDIPFPTADCRGHMLL
jgi:hypothetical protein